jgi:plasmid stabilization system protein ParE
MTIRYTDTALEEIAEIVDYIAHDNPMAGDEVSLAIEDTIDVIRRHPQRPTSCTAAWSECFRLATIRNVSSTRLCWPKW